MGDDGTASSPNRHHVLNIDSSSFPFHGISLLFALIPSSAQPMKQTARQTQLETTSSPLCPRQRSTIPVPGNDKPRYFRSHRITISLVQITHPPSLKRFSIDKCLHRLKTPFVSQPRYLFYLHMSACIRWLKWSRSCFHGYQSCLLLNIIVRVGFEGHMINVNELGKSWIMTVS